MDLSTVALAILRSHPYGFLATTGPARPSVRLVQHLRVDDDATIWIGTSPRSRKAVEIAGSPEVTYAAEDRARFAYAAVSARAEIIEDVAIRKALWEPGLEAFFPEGPGGDDFVLVRLTPDDIELMSFTDGVHPDPYGLRAATLTLRDGV